MVDRSSRDGRSFGCSSLSGLGLARTRQSVKTEYQAAQVQNSGSFGVSPELAWDGVFASVRHFCRLHQSGFTQDAEVFRHIIL